MYFIHHVISTILEGSLIICLVGIIIVLLISKNNVPQVNSTVNLQNFKIPTLNEYNFSDWKLCINHILESIGNIEAILRPLTKKLNVF